MTGGDSLDVLVVDPDHGAYAEIAAALRALRHEVRRAEDGKHAMELLGAREPDVVVTDSVLPDMRATELCRRIRGVSDVCVLMAVHDFGHPHRRLAFEAGVDGLIGKPFDAAEFTARMKRLLRCNHSRPVPRQLEIGELRIDFRGLTAALGGERLSFTPTEWRILECLARYRGRPVPLDMIIASVWGPGSTADDLSLRVHVSNIRSKIERSPDRRRYLLTRPRAGYLLAPE